MSCKVYTVGDFRGTLLEIADNFGIKYNTLKVRMKRGKSLEEAIYL